MAKCWLFANVKACYPYTGLDRPSAPQEVEALRISTKTVHEGDKDVSPTHLPPLPLRKYSWY